MRNPALALLALAIASCSHRTAPVGPSPSPHYVVGSGYQLGGTWSYPQERFQYDATGLAERLLDRAGLTEDGERFDPAAMAGAHRTLQLPAIVDVTNLANGRQIRIRLNDRGPATPGRLLGLTRRAADLLELPATGAAPVRVTLDSAESQSLRDRLGGGPRGITAALVGAVTQESLAAPGQPLRPRATLVAATPTATPANALSESLPETVRLVGVTGGQLWLRVAEFTDPRYARALERKLAGLPVQVRREGAARRPTVVVMAGPFASVAEADAALDQARLAGVTDASIVVE